MIINYPSVFSSKVLIYDLKTLNKIVQITSADNDGIPLTFFKRRVNLFNSSIR